MIRIFLKRVLICICYDYYNKDFLKKNKICFIKLGRFTIFGTPYTVQGLLKVSSTPSSIDQITVKVRKFYVKTYL